MVKRAPSNARIGLVSFALIGAFGCGPSRPAGDAVGVSRSAQDASVAFEYDSLDARPVSSQAFRGRVAILAFITTWDISSQAQTDFLVGMAKRDQGAVNYALVALDDRNNRELVEEYARMLKVTFPVATADAATTMGKGGFGVMAVPTVVVLDEESRVFFRKAGIVRPEEIRAQLVALEKRKTLRPR